MLLSLSLLSLIAKRDIGVDVEQRFLRLFCFVIEEDTVGGGAFIVLLKSSCCRRCRGCCKDVIIVAVKEVGLVVVVKMNE